MKIKEIYLFENYKDFNKIFDFVVGEIEAVEARKIFTSFEKMQSDIKTEDVKKEYFVRRLSDFPSKLESFLKNSRYRGILGSVTLPKLLVQNPLDVSSWISFLNDRRLSSTQKISWCFSSYLALLQVVDRALESRSSKFEIIKKTPSYVLFDILNFAAAKEFKKKANADWCIGVDEGYFNSYGRANQRKTFILHLAKTKKNMVLHIPTNGSSDNVLITSNDNRTEGGLLDNNFQTYRGPRAIQDELLAALTAHEIDDVFAEAGVRGFDYSSTLFRVSDRASNFKNSTEHKEFVRVSGMPEIFMVYRPLTEKSRKYISLVELTVRMKRTERVKKLEEASADIIRELPTYLSIIVAMNEKKYGVGQALGPSEIKMLTFFINEFLDTLEEHLYQVKEIYRSEKILSRPIIRTLARVGRILVMNVTSNTELLKDFIKKIEQETSQV